MAIVEAFWPVTDNTAIEPLELGTLAAANCRAHFVANYFGGLLYANISVAQTSCPVGASWCGVSSSAGTCLGFSGSPVICGDNNQINGMVFREPLCTAPASPLAPLVSMINIADHQEWIRSIAHEGGYGSATSTVASLFVMVASVVLSKVL